MERYQVVIEGNVVIIIFKPKNRKEKVKVHNIHEFVYGQIHYNERTKKYPNYVHKKIWKTWTNK